MISGQDTDTDTQAAIASLVTTIQKLTMRVEMVEAVNRAMEQEQRAIRREAMNTENVVANIWRATMGPIPDPTPDPMPEPVTPDPIPEPPMPEPVTPDPTPTPDTPPPPPTPTPRPRPPRPEPIPTPPPPPKPPSGTKKRVSDAINSIKNAFSW